MNFYPENYEGPEFYEAVSEWKLWVNESARFFISSWREEGYRRVQNTTLLLLFNDRSILYSQFLTLVRAEYSLSVQLAIKRENSSNLSFENKTLHFNFCEKVLSIEIDFSRHSEQKEVGKYRSRMRHRCELSIVERYIENRELRFKTLISNVIVLKLKKKKPTLRRKIHKIRRSSEEMLQKMERKVEVPNPVYNFLEKKFR